MNLDISKPLIRVLPVSLRQGDRETFKVKYEKLPQFCAKCGLLGHSVSECGDGEHERSPLQYGDWLLASQDKRAKP